MNPLRILHPRSRLYLDAVPVVVSRAARGGGCGGGGGAPGRAGGSVRLSEGAAIVIDSIYSARPASGLGDDWDESPWHDEDVMDSGCLREACRGCGWS